METDLWNIGQIGKGSRALSYAAIYGSRLLLAKTHVDDMCRNRENKGNGRISRHKDHKNNDMGPADRECKSVTAREVCERRPELCRPWKFL